MNYVIPLLLVAVFLYGLIKKVRLFETFAEGAREAFKLTLSVAPYLIAIFAALELMRASGMSALIAKWLSPLFGYLGVPVEVSELMILRPLSGSGSLAVLEKLYVDYGADSYAARVASVVMASTDTVMYIAAIYLSTIKDRRSGLAIPISLFASLVGAVLAAALCRIM